MSSPAGAAVATDRARDAGAPLSAHVMWLSGTEWAVWRWTVLRGAGFPADLVLKLAAPRCAALADALIRAEDDARQAQRIASDEVARAARDVASDRKLLHKAKERLAKGTPADSTSIADLSARAAVDRHSAAHARAAAARQEFHEVYAVADGDLDRAIQDIVASNWFREAVIWQNRHAYHRAIDPLLRNREGASASHNRRGRSLVARYLQRYCMKNDTIGFFGPVGWIRLCPDTHGIAVRPGDGLLAARSVYFELWCLDALSEVLSRDRSIRRTATPWPHCAPVDATSRLAHRVGRNEPIELSAPHMTVLRECDGKRTAEEVAGALVASHPDLFPVETAVYDQLAAMHEAGLLAWGLDVLQVARPEVDLRRHLERVGDEHSRAESLRVLTELERARADVAAAAGNPDALDRALDRMEQTFIGLTGVNPTRRGGRTYAGRTIVYEDCRRDLDVEIGADVIEELGRPLSLVLRSARWLSAELAPEYARIFADVHGKLAAESGSPAVDLAAFWRALTAAKVLGRRALPAGAIDTFRLRWRDILDSVAAQAGEGERRRVSCRSDDIRERVEQAFPSRSVGWDRARQHSPDVLIAAESAEAIRRGDYCFVLGELHMALNTLDSSLFLDQHPSPHDIFESMADDLCRPRVMVPKARGRGGPMYLPTDYWVETPAGVACPRARALQMVSLVVVREGEELMVQTRDRRLAVPIVEFFGADLSSVIADSFKNVFGSSSHAPRFTIDRLVVFREQWCFSASAIAWAAEKNDAARFAAARRWARDANLPRFVFVKAAVEDKPFYVDFSSPIYVSLLGQTIRRTAEQKEKPPEIVVTEMLPSHDAMWLTDRDGHRYTSELRMAVSDRAGRPC